MRDCLIPDRDCVTPPQTKADYASVGGLDPVLQPTGISWATKNRLQHLTNVKRVPQCQELCLSPEKNALFLYLQSCFPSFFSSGLPSSSKMSTHHIPERRVTVVQQSKARPRFHVGPATAALPRLPGEGERGPLQSLSILQNLQNFLTDRHAKDTNATPLTPTLHKHVHGRYTVLYQA